MNHQQLLHHGEFVGPDSCGWHYVEGLHANSDRRIAVFWDKVGLGHNGERLPDGGHIVCFVDCDTRHIPASDWSTFLAEQKDLIDGEKQKNVEAPPIESMKTSEPIPAAGREFPAAS